MPDIDFQKIELNLIPKKGEQPVVFYASQYETARPFIADLMWGDSEYAPGVDSHAEIDIRKNDDNLVVITDDVSIDNNEVSVILPVQAVTCIGKNLGQVKIYSSDDHLIAALNFILEVQADPLAGGVTSETAIDNLTQQIEDITQEVIGEDYYNKIETDALLADKADKSELPDMNDYYNKVQTDALLADKADLSDLPDLSNYYTKPETNGLISALANQVNNKFDDIMPIGSATGNPCTFDTEYPYLIQGLKASIVCGGGGGTPSTPIPIVGHSELNLTRCGINLFDEVWEKGTINQTTGEEEPNAYISRSGFIPIAPNTRYYYGYSSQNNVRGYYYDSNKNYIGTFIAYANNAFISDVNASYLRIIIGDVDGIPPLTINYPSTDTAYHAFNGQTFTVAFGQTVYGGLYDKSGRLTITWAGVDMGSLTWQVIEYQGISYKVSNSIASTVKAPTASSETANIKCSIFKNVSRDELDNFNYVICIDPNKNIDIIDNDYSTAADFTTAMSGIMLAYELATPIVIDVRSINFATEDGTNNITSDCIGDVTAYYKDSIQHYIDTRL